MHQCLGCMEYYAEGTDICPHCGYRQSSPAKELFQLCPGTVLQGRYIVGRALGFGGFGVTYIGYDAMLQRKVAIKEFLPSTFATRLPGSTLVSVYEGESTQQFSAGLTRFMDEAKTLAQFNGSPGIVDIYDSFGGNNTAYIVMQYLQGQDVKTLLQDKGPLPYEQALDIILSVCDTLTPVHQKGIIHRDISPDNIFITTDGEIKLLDFGAARYESALNSKSLSVILKSGYAPEEQYRSRGEQGPWTDVYALAATFYKLLCGKTPPDSMERAVKDELVAPSKLGADIPESAENALLNALCVRQGQRTKTVAAFKETLLSGGVQRVKEKPPEKPAGHSSLWVKLALGAGVIALLGLGLFAASGGFKPEEVVVEGTPLQDTYAAPSSADTGLVAVPNIEGLATPQAKELLEQAQLHYEVMGYRYGEEPLTEPLVSSQDKPVGSMVAPGSTVYVVEHVGKFFEAFRQGFVEPWDASVNAGRQGIVLPWGEWSYLDGSLWLAQNPTFGNYEADISYVQSSTFRSEVPMGGCYGFTSSQTPSTAMYMVLPENPEEKGTDTPRLLQVLPGGNLQLVYAAGRSNESALNPADGYVSDYLQDNYVSEVELWEDGGEPLLIAPAKNCATSTRGETGHYMDYAYLTQWQFAQRLPFLYPELAGKNLHCRVRQTEASGAARASIETAAPFRFTVEGETPAADTAELLNPAQLEALLAEESRAWPDWDMGWLDNDFGREGRVTLYCTGNYLPTTRYDLVSVKNDENGPNPTKLGECIVPREGELFCIFSLGETERERFANGEVTLYLMSREMELNENGGLQIQFGSPAGLPQLSLPQPEPEPVSEAVPAPSVSSPAP